MSELPEIPGFTVHHEIGRGGMAVVYLATQNSLDRQVAIKVMSPLLASDPSFSERFLHEARTAGRLQHPGIVSVYDTGIQDHTHFIVIEHIPGGDLGSRLKAGSLSPSQALDITRQLAAALDYAHNKNFVHRDVKPDNILFRESGSAVLTDFGIAKAMGGDTTGLTAAGLAIGTPRYMSPEQARGHPVDGRSDLYSLGVVFHQMLTGKLPYDAPDSFAVGLMHITEPIPDLPEKLSKYQPLLNRLMAKSPDDRYQTGREVLESVTTLLQPETRIASARKTSTARSHQAEPPRHRFSTQPLQKTTGETREIPAEATVVVSRLQRGRWPWLVIAGGLGVVLVLFAWLLTKPAPMPEQAEVEIAQVEAVPIESPIEEIASQITGPDSADASDPDTEGASMEPESAVTMLRNEPATSAAEVVEDSHTEFTQPAGSEQRQDSETEIAHQTGPSPTEPATMESDPGEFLSANDPIDPPARERGPVETESAIEIDLQELVTEIQTELRRLGRNIGIDGVPGPNTRRHLEAFQRATDRATTGQPTAEILAALKATSNWPERVAGDSFRDCPVCPEMLVIPAGEFTMGSPAGEADRDSNEGPQRSVTVAAFALAATTVTFDQWEACRTDGGCRYRPRDQGWGRGQRPVINVSYNDADQYLAWLRDKTGLAWRLPSEAEWEYAARAGTSTPFYTGRCLDSSQANVDGTRPPAGCAASQYRPQTLPVASFEPNAWGLYDMHGNVWEWTADCWNEDYRGASTQGSAWMDGNCDRAVIRGGSWYGVSAHARSANRNSLTRDSRLNLVGFRPARDLR
jgi:serine/threonine-protein kinase PpkA